MTHRVEVTITDLDGDQTVTMQSTADTGFLAAAFVIGKLGRLYEPELTEMVGTVRRLSEFVTTMIHSAQVGEEVEAEIDAEQTAPTILYRDVIAKAMDEAASDLVAQGATATAEAWMAAADWLRNNQELIIWAFPDPPALDVRALEDSGGQTWLRDRDPDFWHRATDDKYRLSWVALLRFGPLRPAR
jgi:hypothetical protein